jgi:hypothetical protein
LAKYQKGRIERTRQGQPEHTALLGDWAIGKTTLLQLRASALELYAGCRCA